MKKKGSYDFRTPSEKKIDELRHALIFMTVAEVLTLLVACGIGVWFLIWAGNAGRDAAPVPVPDGARRLDAGVYSVGEDFAAGSYTVLAHDRGVFVYVYETRERYDQNREKHTFYLNRGERLGRIDLGAGMILRVDDPVLLSAYTPEGA